MLLIRAILLRHLLTVTDTTQQALRSIQKEGDYCRQISIVKASILHVFGTKEMNRNTCSHDWHIITEQIRINRWIAGDHIKYDQSTLILQLFETHFWN